jgi:hypothetical protein
LRIAHSPNERVAVDRACVPPDQELIERHDATRPAAVLHLPEPASRVLPRRHSFRHALGRPEDLDPRNPSTSAAPARGETMYPWIGDAWRPQSSSHQSLPLKELHQRRRMAHGSSPSGSAVRPAVVPTVVACGGESESR